MEGVRGGGAERRWEREREGRRGRRTDTHQGDRVRAAHGPAEQGDQAQRHEGTGTDGWRGAARGGGGEEVLRGAEGIREAEAGRARARPDCVYLPFFSLRPTFSQSPLLLWGCCTAVLGHESCLGVLSFHTLHV